MEQTEYDWYAAQSRAQIACEDFKEKQAAARDAALSTTKSGELAGVLKVTTSERPTDSSFTADYAALLHAVQDAGFVVEETKELATDDSVERVLTLGLEPTLRAEYARRRALELAETETEVREH